MGKALAVALALVAGVAVSHQILYGMLLVPMLPQFHSVPLLMWVAVSGPIWMAGLAGGMRLGTWRQVASSAFIAAVAIQTYETWAARSDQAGFGKSFAIEAPAYFWTVCLVQMTGLVLTLLVVGRLSGFGIRRVTSR